jgi:hypothetical protein
MRAKKRSTLPDRRAILAVANHAAMGTALGLVFALILTKIPFFGVGALINASDDPQATMETFVGVVVMMFGLGAALTGSILMMEDVES